MTDEQIHEIMNRMMHPKDRRDINLAQSDRAHLLAEVERLRGIPGEAFSQSTGNPLFARLPERLQWCAHNVIAHPLSEILFQIGLEDWGNRFHDWTIPEHDPGTGRG